MDIDWTKFAAWLVVTGLLVLFWVGVIWVAAKIVHSI